MASAGAVEFFAHDEVDRARHSRPDASRGYTRAMRLAIGLAITVFAATVAAQQAPPSSGSSRSWDPAAAAAYLDARMDVWFADAPSTQEARLIAETTRRVETYDTHQVLYDFNQRRQIESRGTEAVLNAVILTSADTARNRGEPSETAHRTSAWWRGAPRSGQDTTRQHPFPARSSQ